jgi:enamine deaminase RidA (YjgF/YER057c/UK114 family)
MAGKIEQRLAERGIVLPPAMRAMANYVPYTVTGKHVWVAGQGPFLDGKLHYNGRLGENLTIDDGRACARIVGLNILAQVKAACGDDLDKVVRCVKLNGFVNATPDFTLHPEVINGCSELMIEVFGEMGRHARVAVGAPTLPMGTSVEIDAVFEIR